MIILGIDPGLSITGFGIIARRQGKCWLLECGALKLPASKTLVERVGQFHDFFVEKIIALKVTHIALETSFLGKNAQNFLKLGYLRGVLYVLAHRFSLGILEFSPREVKQAVTGFGAAEKDQVARVILRLFPAMNMPNKLDVTDAVAIALCGLWKSSSVLYC